MQNPEICLFEPEIAQNTGAIARLCACLGVKLNIVEPASFIINDRRIKRVGMDYVDLVDVKFYDSFHNFKEKYDGRIILLDTKALVPYYGIMYRATDCIMLGKESSGVPDYVYEVCDEKVVIPMVPGLRSLNIAMSGAIAISEALRQLKAV
ncbi:MAG: tRNA (cytidine(34)-2'-O)-methyltransferase [Holosporales bacterium]|jgi:tRNA (cytidine/uridine-2'-O-)-methyltransferase|nr:tRNA (cytidine(34)-2'-O)-methyltransferase [Holosporales bacterium]